MYSKSFGDTKVSKPNPVAKPTEVKPKAKVTAKVTAKQ